MKTIKLIPSMLIIILSIAILGVGIYSVVPTEHALEGTITITAGKALIEVQVFDGQTQIGKTAVRGGTKTMEFTQPVDFNCEDHFTVDGVPPKTLTVRITNKSDAPLGVYFVEPEYENGNPKASETRTTTQFLSGTDKVTSQPVSNVIEASFPEYTKVPENNGQADLEITLDLIVLGDNAINVDMDFFIVAEDYVPPKGSTLTLLSSQNITAQMTTYNSGGSVLNVSDALSVSQAEPQTIDYNFQSMIQGEQIIVRIDLENQTAGQHLGAYFFEETSGEVLTQAIYENIKLTDTIQDEQGNNVLSVKLTSYSHMAGAQNDDSSLLDKAHMFMFFTALTNIEDIQALAFTHSLVVENYLSNTASSSSSDQFAKFSSSLSSVTINGNASTQIAVVPNGISNVAINANTGTSVAVNIPNTATSISATRFNGASVSPLIFPTSLENVSIDRSSTSIQVIVLGSTPNISISSATKPTIHYFYPGKGGFVYNNAISFAMSGLSVSVNCKTEYTNADSTATISAQNNVWNIGETSFASTTFRDSDYYRFVPVKFRMIVTNQGSVPIKAEINSILAPHNKSNSETFDITITGNDYIPADETKEIFIQFALPDDAPYDRYSGALPISDFMYSVVFTEQTLDVENYVYNLIEYESSSNNDLGLSYYIPFGEYYVSGKYGGYAPIKWYVWAKYKNGKPVPLEQSDYVVDNGKNKLAKGNTYCFINEGLPSTGSDISTYVYEDLYTEYKEYGDKSTLYYTHYSDDVGYRYLSDYSQSNLRSFYNGNIVKCGTSYIENGINLPNGSNVNFYDYYKLKEDIIFSLIIGRTLENLYSNIDVDSGGALNVPTYNPYIKSTDVDLFWLLSWQEINILPEGEYSVIWARCGENASDYHPDNDENRCAFMLAV